ncbi:hypothetical protein Ddye_030798 [Dipteronia dyeriana]|uniref:Cytochrome P450 n=1 Tax=Dipteronia dyeriana TaxID=168575 RepID=A0AAD9THR2_9ROSI|nr:hypothetical protein Ddye_030798 [Dipteronia dyeriana]
MALHHDRQIWGEDVHLFKPERFSEGVAKAANNNPAAFFPFGLGPRTCMGSNFAFTEAKIVLSMILQRYIFTLSPSYIHSPFPVLTVSPQHGIRGPPFRFVHGNTKEIINMRKEVISSPMELSHLVFPRIQPHIYSWMKLYGKNFIIWHGHQPQLVVMEPEQIKEILNNKDGSYPKTKLEGYAKKLLGDGLVTSEGEKWFQQRKLANHAFHGESLKGMIPAMIASVEMMLERWRQHDGKEIEVFQEFRILTSEVISRTAFGSSYLEGQNIFDMLVKMASNSIICSRYRKLVKTPDDVESDKLLQGIQDSFVKMITKREEKVKMGKLDNYGNDFFESLLRAYHDTDKTKKITVDDMIDECKTFYIAGHETTTSLLTWTILLLAIHTDWQEKLRKEVLELFGKQNPKPDSIGRMKTMSMVVNETLRLYPPFVQIMRRINREVRLGKLTLPVNMEVYIPTIAAHHNPDIWGEDVHLFKPERFSQGVGKATNNNTAAFLPFGLGPRACVGLNFAITEAKIALSMILQRYKFSLSPNYVHSPIQILTTCPQHGLQIMLQSL